jgi:hypothetical protein
VEVALSTGTVSEAVSSKEPQTVHLGKGRVSVTVTDVQSHIAGVWAP